jgi:hypothetical protein
LSRRASHRHGTRRAARYRTECEKSPAGGRRRGGHSEAGSCRCKSRHRGGSMPTVQSVNLNSYNTTSHLGDCKWGCSPSWPSAGLEQSHYPAPIGGCCPESLATRIDRRRPSCGQSFPGLGREP